MKSPRVSLIAFSVILVLSFIGCSIMEPPEDFSTRLKSERVKSLDRSAPVVRITYPVMNMVLPTFVVSNEVYEDVKLEKVEVSIDGKNWKECSDTGDGTNFVYTFKGVPDGLYTLTVRAVDWAGNVGEDFMRIRIVGGVFVGLNGDDSVSIPSREKPFKTFSRAISYASSTGLRDILVSEGTYTFSTNFFGIYIQYPVNIYGGYSTNFSERDINKHKTIIDGEGKVSYVVSVSGAGTNQSVVIDGLFIRGAVPLIGTMGGIGIYAVSSRVEIVNTTIESNASTLDAGAGIRAENSIIILSNSTVQSNASPTCSGIYLANSTAVLCDSVLRYSSSTNGGALYAIGSTAIVSNSHIEFNTALNGGGIFLSEGSHLAGTGLIAQNNTATNKGGFIFAENSSIALSNSTIQLNSSLGEGGGIFATNSSLNCLNLIISANQSTNGGGIYAVDSSVSGVIAVNNTATNGGGIYAVNSSLEEISASTNQAMTNGGGVYALESTISKLTAENNSSSGTGGGLFVSNVSISNAVLRFNTSVGHGAGIFVAKSSNAYFIAFGITNEFNKSEAQAGGIYAEFIGRFEVYNSSISFNTNNLSSHNAGGIYVVSTNGKFVNTTIANNFASENGGGILIYQHSHFVFLNCFIVSNRANGVSAGGMGGGIDITCSTNFFSNCIISYNSLPSSGYGGGVVINNGGKTTFVDCTFEHNSSGYGGALCLPTDSETYITNCVIKYNTATGTGGGIYTNSGLTYETSNLIFEGNTPNDIN